MTPREAFEALYYETVPIRITRPAANACTNGPTEQWRLAESQRELWALAADNEPDELLAEVLGRDDRAGAA